MADHKIEGLSYGQLGTPLYDVGEQCWSYSRSPGTRKLLHRFDESTLLIAPEASVAGCDSGRPSKNPSRLQRRIKTLCQEYPEIEPAAFLLPDLVRTSEAIENATRHYDPSTQNLMACSQIYDERDKSFVDVIALPHGPNGSDLQVMLAPRSRRGWRDSQDAWLEVPGVGPERAIWKGPGVSIRSIIFANPKERTGNYLAVRMIEATAIFRPILRRSICHGTSRMDLNLVCYLSSTQTGGITHADVAFNRWLPRRFAIVDHRGSWSTWELGGRGSGLAKSLQSGSSSHEDEQNEKFAVITDDGWARVLWIAAVDLLVVATRRKLTLLNAETKDVVARNGEKNSGLQDLTGWLLDISTLPNHESHFCVLTSQSICIYGVSTEPEMNHNIKLVLSIQHHRYADDLSLRLYAWEDDSDLVITLRSACCADLVQYRLEWIEPDRPHLREPVLLQLQSCKLQHDYISDVRIERVYLGQKRSLQSDTSAAMRYVEQDLRFYSIFILLKNMELQQQLFSQADQEEEIYALEWEQTPYKSNTLVSDLDVENERNGSDSRYRSDSSFARRRRDQSVLRPELQWTIDFQLTTALLNRMEIDDVTEIIEVLEDTRDTLDHANAEVPLVSRTLLESADGEMTINDFELIDRVLADLRSTSLSNARRNEVLDEAPVEASTQLVVHSIARPSEFDLPEVKGSSTLCKAILERWNMASTAPYLGVTAVAREYLARRVTAEVLLSSHAFRLREVYQDLQEDTQTSTQTWELPVRPQARPTLSRGTSSVYFEASSQPMSSVLPTPSPSATPSMVTGSSYTSTYSALEMNRLSNYTMFTKPAPPTLPRALNQMLSHWTLGTDPAGYDWLATSRAISRHQEEAEEEGEMTEKERLRLQRRAERYVRRQRREAEESQRQQALSNRATEIVSASSPIALRRLESQPTTAGPEPGSSQSMVYQPAMASQVLPGRHGGRPPAKKKRKSGF